ncbi:MAG TPA: UbiA family prenyltransferase [Terracidiphilus sp.]|nr:UbiA family prenyltransferase [Terracidiphilus sp.]
MSLDADTAPAPDMHPLCVDLDGTLVKSDTLLDALCQLLRDRPLAFWRAPLWLSGGRARFKLEVARLAPLEPARLPYNTELVRYLQSQHRAGRPMYLATGADGDLAERVAAHLGLFQGVLATDLATNLTSVRKLRRLKDRFGDFDYIGNSRADLALLAHARQAMVANPTLGLRLGLRLRHIPVTRSFQDQRPVARTLVQALRLGQWSKNVLLFAPLLLSHPFPAAALTAALAAFFCFSFMASAGYLVNDLLDIDSDRRHPSRRLRPFAAGNLPVATGAALALAMAVASLALLPFLPTVFALWLGLYILASAAYSLYLKRVPIVDVLLLSGLYTLRLLAGGAATATPISQWLAAFSTFLFLSLAMVKRFSELESLRERGATASHGRRNLVADLKQLRSFGIASAYAAVVVFLLYIAHSEVTQLYHHPERLWLIAPLLLYWLHRVWRIALRGELDDDPVVFALRDRVSLALGLCIVALAYFAV